MEFCPKCKSNLNIDEKNSGKCFTCGESFEPILTNNQKANCESSSRSNICKILIGLFLIIFCASLFLYVGSNQEYLIAKGDVASARINAIQSNIWNLNPNVNTSKLDQITLKRTIYIGCMIVSIIGIIISCIVMFNPKENSARVLIKNTQNNTSSIQDKLQELEQIYMQHLITEEEYQSKKKELLDRL